MSYTAIYILRRASIDKNKHIPVYLRISTSTKDRCEFYTGIKVTEDQWVGKGGKTNKRGIKSYIKGTTNKIKQFNIKLDDLLSKIQEKETELRKAGMDITSDELLSSLRNEKTSQFALSEALTRIVQSKNANSTKQSAKRSKTLILQFLKNEYGVEDIDVKKLELKTYKAITLRLGEWGEKKSYSPGHIKKMIHLLKNAIQYSIDAGHMDSDPTAQYVYKGKKHVTTPAPALTIEEFIRLKNVTLEKDFLKRTRDMFVFQCHTGLSLVDFRKLTKDDLHKGIDGQTWIIKKRQKTSVYARIPLTTGALDIIEKYKDSITEDGRLLPVLGSTRYNENLKTLAKLADIGKNVTTHSARHTFGTLLLESGVSLEDIANMMAHTNIEQTKTYAQMTDLKLRTELEKLEKRIQDIA